MRPIACGAPRFNYYFSKFWNYADIGCRDLEMAEMVVPDTTTIMVITAVEEKTINRTACSAIGQCTKDVKVNNFFTVDPEVRSQWKRARVRVVGWGSPEPGCG